MYVGHFSVHKKSKFQSSLLQLILNGFPECVVNSSVSVVKAHMWDKVSVFSRIILLIREPQKTLLAEYNRRRGNGHLALATRQDFTANRKWPTFGIQA